MTTRQPRTPSRAGRARSIPAAWLAALLCCAPAAASAATYYLSPTGSDSNSGLSAGSAWATLSKANATVRGGDVVLVADGSYSGFPNPSSDGSPSARITFVGDLATPANVSVGSGTLNRSYVTIKGMRFNGGASLGPNGSAVAQHDSVAWCAMSSFSLSGAKHCMIYGNTITNVGGYAVTFLSSNGDQVPTGFANPEYDTLRKNVVTIARIPQDTRGMMFTSRMQFCVIDSNTVSGTFNASAMAGRSYLFRFRHSFYNRVADNSFTVSAENQPAGQDWAMYCLRDSVHHMQFVRNRYTTTGSYPIEIFMSQSGDDTWQDDVKQNSWDGCFWNIQTPAAGTYPGLNWQDGMSSDTLRYCVIKADQGPGAYIELMRTANVPSGQAVNVIDHCTFYGRASGSDGPLTLSLAAADWPSGVGLKVTNSIFYTGSTTSGSQYNTGFTFRVPTNRTFVSNGNLFAHYAGAAKSIWYQVDGGASGYSAPGTSGWLCVNGSAQGWGGGLDCQSRYGSPMFQDSSRAGFDPRLRPGSAAIGAGLGGTDAGAISFGAVLPDLMRPAPILDLSWQPLPRRVEFADVWRAAVLTSRTGRRDAPAPANRRPGGSPLRTDG